ncbi:hypothetical protein STVA_13590 [Allostella vacuolata]|nr:hypothetical protein STVA_13590 [Stella vacuolata]
MTIFDMTLVELAARAAMALVGLGLVGVAWRLLTGPSAADRVIATDMLGLLAIAIAALTAVLAIHAAFLDIAFAIALFGFLGAVAFAGLLEGAAERRPEVD